MELIDIYITSDLVGDVKGQSKSAKELLGRSSVDQEVFETLQKFVSKWNANLFNIRVGIHGSVRLTFQCHFLFVNNLRSDENLSLLGLRMQRKHTVSLE